MAMDQSDYKLFEWLRGYYPDADAQDLPVAAQAQTDAIAPVEQAEYRLQQVIAIGTTPGDVQKQVQLRRCRPPRPRARLTCIHHGSQPVHWSTSRRTRACPLTASIRRGNAGRVPSASYHWLK